MTIKAIETKYAGCRFRSRLEARWAVFLDHLGVEWEYEPQGFEVSHRLTLTEGTFAYLPDFWLPDLGLWAEVKGSLTDDECTRLLDAAAALSSNDGGGCHDAGGNDVVVLGPIPKSPVTTEPWRLHMHKGDLTAHAWRPWHSDDSFGSSCPLDGGRLVASDYGGSLYNITHHGDFETSAIATTILAGYSNPFVPLGIDRALRALTAARSARFEHGEHG